MLKAEAFERLAEPAAPTPGERRGLAVALVAAAALHLLVPVALLAYYALWPVAVPVAQQEVPVELVEEPPPPKPDKPEDKPKPPPEPDDERPAYDAPAPATQEKINRESADNKTQAPAAQDTPPPNPGAPPKTETAKAESAPAQEQKEQSAAPQHDLRPTPDGEEPADVNPTPNANAAPAAAQAPAAPPAKAPEGAPLPTIETLPEYKMARAVKESPIATGNADSRYFTIVFGMIRSHLREPSGPGAVIPSKPGAVVFGVDESGNLIGRKLMNSSGSPNLDMAVMTAILEAAPYPAPPNWQPRTMRLTYGGH